MKKILSVAAAIALAAALISCGDSSDEFSGAVDTYKTLSAPSVKAKAYPGVNYVTWAPVAQATSYDVYRIADGAASGTYLGNVTAAAGTAKADIASTSNVIADGKTYEYVVVALAGNTNNTSGSTVPTRSIYLAANKGSASVKAYVPAAGTKITDFTDSYTKNFLKKYADAKSLEKAGAKITFVNDVLGGGDLYATYPATAGFKFGVKFINKTQPDFIKKANTNTNAALYLEDYTANETATTLGAGEYEAYVTVAPVCDFYPTTVTFSLGTYTIPELKVTKATAITSAKFVSEKKAVVQWTPAVLASTKAAAPTTNYKVYRTEGTLADGNTLVAVTAEIKTTDLYNPGADTNNIDTVVTNNAVVANSADEVAKIYYVEDEVPAAGQYTYFVVNTDGTEFEKIGTTNAVAYVSSTANAYALNTTKAPTINGVNISKDKDNLLNVIKVTATKGDSKQKKLTLSYINLDATVTDNSVDYVKTFDASKFTTAEVTTNNDITEESYIFYVEKAAIGTYLLKLTAEEDGKAPQSAYQIVYVTGVTNVDISGLTITQTGALTTDNKALIVDTSVTPDTVGLYKYQLVKVETVTPNTTANDYISYVTVTSTTTDITVKYDTGISAADNADLTKDYAKYGVATEPVDPAATTITYKTRNAYAIVSGINGETSTAGKATKRVFSVKKILAADATNYKYSDNNTNGTVTKNY